MSTLLPAITPGHDVPTSSRAPPGHLPAKRTRTQLSCTNCRHAKLKCDRKLPCSPCIKRGRDVHCTFPPPAGRKKPAESMQSRLRHLESLVKDAMNSQAPSIDNSATGYVQLNGMRHDNVAELKPNLGRQTQVSGTLQTPFAQSPMTATKAATSGSSGQVVQSVKETTYVGATHWAAILEDIEEVKSYFSEADPEEYTAHDGLETDMSMLFNFNPHASKDSLLDALPARGIVDKLVFRVFNSNSSTQYIIHKPTFQKEYNVFWANPSEISLSWLAQLYALMILGTMAYLWTGEESPDTSRAPIELIRSYRSSCAQCLVLSNYTQPGPYTIEAFIIYMESEFLLSNDEKVNCFLLVGSVVRLAFRVGLHRDPSKMEGTFTPFQAEIRRRVWHVLLQIDLLAGFHLGLPSMIQSVDSDTDYPRNLKDEDFYEDIFELPVGRPESDPTPILYIIAKARICEVFARIAAQASRLTPLSYDETLKLDELLNISFARVPPHLRRIPLGLAITDSSEVIMQRFNIALIYYKSLCVLHRKYLIKEREHHEYAYSKKVGLGASMEILSCQSAIYEAIQPGGPLAHDKWYIASLPMHDFLLAATIVSIVVLRMVDHTAADHYRETPERTRHEMTSALEKSHSIWRDTQNISVDTKKAFVYVGFMMEKIKLATPRSVGSNNACNVHAYNVHGVEPSVNSISELSMHDSTPLAESQATDYAYHEPSEAFGSVLPFTMNAQLGPESMSIPTESLGTMLDMTTDFDWDAFDSHVRQQYQLPDKTWPDSMFDGI